MPPQADRVRTDRATLRPGLVDLTLVGAAAFLGGFALVGADLLWLVALGDHIRDTGAVPEGLPFAAADTSGWENAVVASELLLSLLHDAGPWALPLAQVGLATCALALLGTAARRAGGTDGSAAAVLAIVVLSSLPTLVVVRLQMLSLVPFALLLLLLHADAHRPSRRIWWMPLLVVVWTNLHGAVLLGVCVAGAYLAFHRLRLKPVETVLVGLATVLAVVATPAGPRGTLHYYVSVMGNEAASRGTGLWAPLDPSQPFDVVLVIGAVVLLAGALRRRRRLWEYVVLAGLLVATLMAARHGVWLVMAASVPAADGLRRTRLTGLPTRTDLPSTGVLGAIVVAAGLVLVRGPSVLPDDRVVVDEVVAAADGRVVLAPAPMVEMLAVRGVTVWAGNPIDAFEQDVQAAYLDFLDGGPAAIRAVRASDLVVVEQGTPGARLMHGRTGFRATELGDGWTLYEPTG